MRGGVQNRSLTEAVMPSPAAIGSFLNFAAALVTEIVFGPATAEPAARPRT